MNAPDHLGSQQDVRPQPFGPCVSSSRFRFELATGRDDAELRALLRRNAMGERIRVTFEREPSFFDAVAIQGDFQQVITARDAARRRIAGMGTRSIGTAFLNGCVSPLGYLSDLRVDPRYRNGTIVARGYRFLRQLHSDGRTRSYYTVIFSDNQQALRTIAQGRAGLPAYHDCGRLLCPGIVLARRKPKPAFADEIVRGNAALLPEIVECLNRNNRRKQFAPLHRIEDFRERGRWRSFRPEDFYVARRTGKVIGVIGKWDQRAFKQTRVVGYGGALRWLWRVSNLLRRVLDTPRLPAPGPKGSLSYFHASFVAVDDDALDTFRALLREVYNDAVAAGDSYFLIGLHERDPLAAVLDEYSLISFTGRLFCVCFPEDEAAFHALDSRIPYVEAATL